MDYNRALINHSHHVVPTDFPKSFWKLIWNWNNECSPVNFMSIPLLFVILHNRLGGLSGWPIQTAPCLWRLPCPLLGLRCVCWSGIFYLPPASQPRGGHLLVRLAWQLSAWDFQISSPLACWFSSSSWVSESLLPILMLSLLCFFLFLPRFFS